MLLDYITYLKTIIESTIVGRDGETHTLNGRFYEIYPEPSKIKELCPCAALRQRPGNMKENGNYVDRVVTDDDITLVQKLYDRTIPMQVDFYSTDIYDFIERDGTYTGVFQQFINLIAHNSPFNAASDGRSITVTLGPHGLIDTDIVKDSVYKAFCQVTFKDGVFKDITVPKITGATISEGGIS